MCIKSYAEIICVFAVISAVVGGARIYLGNQDSLSLAGQAAPPAADASSDDGDDDGRDAHADGPEADDGVGPEQRAAILQILSLKLLFYELLQFAPLQRVVREALQFIADRCPDVNAPAHHGARAGENMLYYVDEGVQYPVIRPTLKANIEPHRNCRGLPSPTAVLGRVILGASRLSADPDSWELQWYLQAITRLMYWQLTPEGEELSAAAEALIRVRQQVQNPRPVLRNSNLRGQVALFTVFIHALRAFLADEGDITQCDHFIQDKIAPFMQGDLTRLQELLLPGGGRSS